MTPSRPPRCGVLLAGGAGTRFGGVLKGLLPLGSERVADGALRALMDVCDDVVIAGNDAAAGDWFPGHRLARDREAGLGALGALHTALHAAPGQNVVVCAWDMPFVSAALLTALIDIVERGAPCCVPEHANGRLEPLCAAYAPICATAVTSLLASHERAAHAIVDAVGGTRWAIGQELSPDASARTFFNVNTPDDLRRAESWLLPQFIRST